MGLTTSPRMPSAPLCLLYHFHAEKALFKVPNLQYKFLDWKGPPSLLEFFQKFIRFGDAILPLEQKRDANSVAILSHWCLVYSVIM